MACHRVCVYCNGSSSKKKVEMKRKKKKERKTMKIQKLNRAVSIVSEAR